MNLESAIDSSLQYLNSEEANDSVRRNPYWPKWNSPWWHMSVLFEMGMADKIPNQIATLMLSEIRRTHLPYFFREEAPLDKREDQDAPCPCALGNIYQILTAIGLDVDASLPWARAWFLKYQMPDGGLSCDEDAYKAEPNASSIVGTISPLEAILKTRETFALEEKTFLDQGANCLLERELRLGSLSRHNSEERQDEADWLKPCFPRFYLYDVLRGLSFILLWAKKRKKRIKLQAIENVVTRFQSHFPSGDLKAQRLAFEGITDRKKQPASYFDLLNFVSRTDQVSPFLTSEWTKAQTLLAELQNEGYILGKEPKPP